jgi:hypothetical protein
MSDRGSRFTSRREKDEELETYNRRIYHNQTDRLRVSSAHVLIIGLSAQERHEGSARRSRAHTPSPNVKNFRLADTYRLSFYDRTPDSASVPANWFVGVRGVAEGQILLPAACS